MVKRLLVKKKEELLSEFTHEIFPNGIITVGNDSSATLTLEDETIAPEQLVIVCEDDAMTLLCRDEGTSVNGEILAKGALHNLQIGDLITVGEYNLIIQTEDTGDAAKTPPNSSSNEASTEILASHFDQPKSTTKPKKSKEKPERGATERSLTDVLEGLRSEEKFYFLIKDASHADRRIYVETEEMWLGWSNSGECVLTTSPDEVEIPRAQIRKDWSGVVIYPIKSGNIWLNEETLTEPHRLKNDDKLFLLGKEGVKLDLETIIKFHEPTALLILDSILPKQLPPPVLLDASANDIGGREIDEADLIEKGKIPQSSVDLRGKRQIFGYFTVTEIIIMTIGTLITAAVIFFILEWY